MHIAIPVWDDRVSPLFDTALRILLIRFENGRETARAERSLHQVIPPMRVRLLVEEGVDTLICGAISRRLADMCLSSGLTVIPWVSGTLEEVVVAFLTGGLSGPQYIMPGCCGGRLRARRRQGRGRGRGRGAVPARPRKEPI
jgi:predicted Fe-Mo cluster-binding NifX family protein